MPKIIPPAVTPSAANNTVKLPATLQRRVAEAMRVEGFTVWAEFCRVALTEKCHRVEDHLRSRDPADFQRLYGQAEGGRGRSAKKSSS
jgi:hypothetical protein